MSVKISEDWVMVEERKKGNERDRGEEVKEKKKDTKREFAEGREENVFGF